MAPTFTDLDVQNLIAVAQAAPLRNMKEAESVSLLLQRFRSWHEHVTKETAKAPRKRAPDVQDSDPTA
jgi:hypothetical protein